MDTDHLSTIRTWDPDAPLVVRTVPPSPKLPKKGVYVLEPGDTPGVVARKLFGRGSRAVDVVRANPDCDWIPGSEITIPD